jgi:hypothetical protein
VVTQRESDGALSEQVAEGRRERRLRRQRPDLRAARVKSARTGRLKRPRHVASRTGRGSPDGSARRIARARASIRDKRSIAVRWACAILVIKLKSELLDIDARRTARRA